MAGSNVQGDISGHIFPEFDYNNIILIDPNKTIDSRGVVSERIVDHENLVMYANLEAQILPRTKLALGVQPNDTVDTTMTIARMNFLKPTKNNFLGTGYYDELTGKDVLTMQNSNAMLEKVNTSANKAYYVSTVLDQQNVVDNALLGITSINCRLGTSFIPAVTMQLEDIQGRALFQLGDNSPYAAFFNLPYPQFYLTLKGYFGQAIRYQLYLEKFDARFNTSTGNYSITLEFKGFKFNILNEILISHLLAAPHMYNRRFATSLEPVVANASTNTQNLSNQASAQQGNRINTNTQAQNSIYAEFVTEKGYQKIVEVYSDYKSKGLIPMDFPELTLIQLVNKLEMFEKNIISSYPQSNVEPLTNIRNYQATLKSFYEDIRGTQPSSWFSTNLDPRPIILKNGDRVYFFKQIVRDDANSQQAAMDDLTNRFKKATDTLRENPTLGENKPDGIKINNLTTKTLEITIDKSQIDLKPTAASFYNVLLATTEQETSTDAIINVLLSKKGTIVGNTTVVNEPIFYTFDGIGRFNDIISQTETEVRKKLSTYELAISEELKLMIQDKANGIGFIPTVRNMTAVLMANAEGFIRLMDECHTNAWNVKYDPVRRLVIQDTDTSAGKNIEAAGVVQITSQAAGANQGLVTGQPPVYPWPQFYVESLDDKRGKFQLRYLGEPALAKRTQAYDFKKWPEVEFVEEYMKGLIMKDNIPSSQSPLETQLTTFIIQINALEYPTTNVVYANKDELKYFYEIWEREFLTAHYSGYIRALDTQIDPLITLNTGVESNNIIESLKTNNPFLTFKLKNTNLTPQNYPSFLRQISNNGTGQSYINFERDIFVTPYINALVETPFSILKINELGLQPLTTTPLEGLLNLTKNASNNFTIVDTYPFTNQQWVQNNMSQSNRATLGNTFNTSEVITVFEKRNVISNFTDIYNFTTSRPVTSFSYISPTIPSIVEENASVSSNVTTQTMSIYYDSSILNNQNFLPTVGIVETPTSTNLPKQQTTSILNTPFFINAIQNGVRLQKRNQKYPYIQAAYLFLNSLPLISLRERYKTYAASNDLDYIASCFNKFGAIHKLPYAWILKIGSLWYRYKTAIETQTDILDGIWDDFDFLGNFDPIFSAKTTSYEVRSRGVKQDISLEQINQNSIQIQTGFYPKLINNFAYFYNGVDLFSGYTNQEIGSAQNDGLLVYSFPNSNFFAKQDTKDVSVQTWSVLLPTNLRTSYNTVNNCDPVLGTAEKGVEYFIIPSFGVNTNQTNFELVSNQTSIPTINTDLVDNTAMFNGSVRCYWAASNYGYFDAAQAIKPSTTEYLNEINPAGPNVPFKLLNRSDYSTMEDFFGVFDRKALDIMEKEFLNYCEPMTNIKYGIVNTEIGKSIAQIDGTSRNFQAFMREAMKLPPTQFLSEEFIFPEAITEQFNSFSKLMKNFMEYDVIIRNGNPSKYARRLFDSFISIGQATPSVVDPIRFQPYVNGSLPTNGGGVTLLQSETSYPVEWRALRTEVGFSTIPGLEYTDNGSYITDFFVDNNIKFDVRNITLCSQLIKMYATQKLENPALTAVTFRQNLTNYLNSNITLQDRFLQQVLEYTRARLPDIEEPKEQSIQSAISGLQGKVEIYNVFKSLNDKWVAGYDYSQRTLFEDILFLDRASRNIGDTVIMDIFSIKNLINRNALNENMSVYTLLAGMLMQNNFVVMPLPAYCNFYNVQNVDGVATPNTEKTLEFADNMWGTFTNVDTRTSGPKIVCFYVGRPSEQLGVSARLTGVGDDSFDLRVPPGNPIIENQQGKTDWALSNKVVGFNVDIGIRNQNVFQTFSVSQDNGKATSESIAAILMMADQTNTRNVGTQNVSLYNLYKRRSYMCDVSALGNALIQPTMYFNLRHVPMFNGPYLITDVNHVITPGEFITNFTGVRQGIYDYPLEDNFLQKINQNLLTKIEEIVIQKTNQNTTLTTTNEQSAANLIVNSNATTADAENSCRLNLSPQFEFFQSSPAVATPLSAREFADALINNPNTASNAELQTVIYILSYVRTFSTAGDPNGRFNAFNYNFGNITLDKSIAGPNQNFVPNVYSCIKTKRVGGTFVSLPAAKFSDVNGYIKFMQELLNVRLTELIQGGPNGQGTIIPYYCTSFPSQQVTQDYFDRNSQRFYSEFEPVFIQALDSARRVGLRTDIGIFPAQNNAPNNQNTQSPQVPACPPTTITGFSTPNIIVINNAVIQTAKPGDIVTLGGSNLQYTRVVEIGYQTPQQQWFSINTTTLQLISPNKLKFSIPFIPQITVPTQMFIRLTTSGNANPIVSTQSFEFIP